MKFDEICVVGGGSAGWMTAALLVQHFKGNKRITVVESPNIGTIGVGESTTQHFSTFKRFLGLDDSEWMPACDATYKNSIRFEDWGEEKPFHYPFGDYDTNLTHVEWWWWRAKNQIDSQSFQTTFSNAASVAEAGKLYLPNVESGDIGYHFDATKMANYLRDKYCLLRGVNHIRATVQEIDVEGGNIKGLHLDTGEVIGADLFIDCTGFRAILMNKLHVPWESWNNILHNDSTWAIRKPYQNKREELTAYTRVSAMPNGWAWTVPTYERIGTGYNYSSRHCSKLDALIDFKHFLGMEDTSDREFRHLSWPTGIRKRIWSGNCVAIGLSAGFIEPLESGGLYSVHEFLFHLIQFIDSDTRKLNGMMRDFFNEACRDQFTAFRDFVASHYTLAKKDNTRYWDFVTNIEHRPVTGLFPQNMQSIDNLYDSYAYLLGGMQYNLIGPRELMDNPFDTGYISDIISTRLRETQGAIDNNPVPLDYYKSTLYKEQLS